MCFQTHFTDEYSELLAGLRSVKSSFESDLDSELRRVREQLGERALEVRRAVNAALVLPVRETVEGAVDVWCVMFERDEFFIATSLRIVGETLTLITSPLVNLSCRLSNSLHSALASTWSLWPRSSEAFAHWFDTSLARAQDTLISAYNLIDPIFNVCSHLSNAIPILKYWLMRVLVQYA